MGVRRLLRQGGREGEKQREKKREGGRETEERGGRKRVQRHRDSAKAWPLKCLCNASSTLYDANMILRRYCILHFMHDYCTLDSI